MNSIVQTEAARIIILGLEKELAGKGHYGESDFEEFVNGVVNQLSELTGMSRDAVAEALQKQEAACEHLRTTGNENPIFFSSCCQTVELSLSYLRGCGLELPSQVSVGFIERHENVAFAATHLDPPLIVFSSGQFDLMWDIAFSLANPTLSVTGWLGRIAVGEHDPDEQALLSEVLIHHALSSRAYESLTGEGVSLFENRIGESPELRAKIYSENHREHFLNLLITSRRLLPSFVIGHELTHLSSQARQFREKKLLREEELFCDEMGMRCAAHFCLAAAREARDQAPMLYSKLAMLLNYVQVTGFLEIVKTAEQQGMEIASVSSSQSYESYPSVQERMNNAKRILFEVLERRVSHNTAGNLSDIWVEIGRRNRIAFEKRITEIDSQIRRPYRRPEEIVEFIEEWSRQVRDDPKQ